MKNYKFYVFLVSFLMIINCNGFAQGNDYDTRQYDDLIFKDNDILDNPQRMKQLGNEFVLDRNFAQVIKDFQIKTEVVLFFPDLVYLIISDKTLNNSQRRFYFKEINAKDDNYRTSVYSQFLEERKNYVRTASGGVL